MRILRAVSVMLSVVLLAACQYPAASTTPSTSQPTPVVTTTPSGLQYQDISEGTGPTPRRGQTVAVHYTGWLADGKQFDSSKGKQPISFVLGGGNVIKGWDEGILTMKQGGKRKLIIPPALAYGADGFGNLIPPNATLTFDVELVSVR